MLHIQRNCKCKCRLLGEFSKQISVVTVYFEVKATRIFHFVFFLMKQVITMYHTGRGCETTIIHKISLVLKTVTSVRNIPRSCSWPMKSPRAACGQQGRLGLSLPPTVCWQAVAAGAAQTLFPAALAGTCAAFPRCVSALGMLNTESDLLCLGWASCSTCV